MGEYLGHNFIIVFPHSSLDSLVRAKMSGHFCGLFFSVQAIAMQPVINVCVGLSLSSASKKTSCNKMLA